MLKAWFEKYKILTPVAKAFNMLLRSVSQLKLKHFQAHALSNSSNGTGSHVSKNYLCLGRSFECIITLPRTQHESNDNIFQKELVTVTAFCNATVACLSRVMSTERHIDDIELAVHVYLDTMVAMDKSLQPSIGFEKNNKAHNPNFVKSNFWAFLLWQMHMNTLALQGFIVRVE